jgi:hypothetical protein
MKMSTFELKHVRGIPYYIRDGIVHTFESEKGRASKECIAIGEYDRDSDAVRYYGDWKERINERLTFFRESIASQDRKTMRESIIKPQKPKKATRTPRKSSNTAANTKDK